MQRLITGTFFGAFWGAILYSQSYLLLWSVVTLIGIGALHEYFHICLSDDERTFRRSIVMLCAIPLLSCYWARLDVLLSSILLTLFINILFLLRIYSKLSAPFNLLAKSCFGIIFISLCAAHLTMIAAYTESTTWIFLLTIIIVASDTGAYYTGTMYGKNKLCPNISPGKTQEGFWGGVLFSTVCGIICGYFVLPEVNIFFIAGTSALLSCVGVVGDLSESTMKRTYHVKDSGTILPGHGGILDRIDSLLASGPAMFYIIYYGHLL